MKLRKRIVHFSLITSVIAFINAKRTFNTVPNEVQEKFFLQQTSAQKKTIDMDDLLWFSLFLIVLLIVLFVIMYIVTKKKQGIIYKIKNRIQDERKKLNLKETKDILKHNLTGFLKRKQEYTEKNAFNNDINVVKAVTMIGELFVGKSQGKFTQIKNNFLGYDLKSASKIKIFFYKMDNNQHDDDLINFCFDSFFGNIVEQFVFLDAASHDSDQFAFQIAFYLIAPFFFSWKDDPNIEERRTVAFDDDFLKNFINYYQKNSETKVVFLRDSGKNITVLTRDLYVYSFVVICDFLDIDIDCFSNDFEVIEEMYANN